MAERPPETPQADPQAGGEAGGAPDDDRKPRRSWRRWFRWPKRVVQALLLLVVLAFAALNWSPPGQRLVLDTALDQLRGALAGELRVEGIRSGNLIQGVTLTGIVLRTSDDRPFLTVDSIRGRWSLPGLLVGQPSLSSLTLWGPHVEISRYAEDQAMTVARLLPDRAPQPDSVGRSATVIRLGRVRLEGGLIEVLSPAPGATEETPATVPNPTGEGRLSRLGLEGLEAELDEAVLRLGGTEPFSAFLARLVTDVSFQEEPIEIMGGEGYLRFGPRGLTVEEGHFRFPGTVMAGRMELGPRVTEGDAWAFATELRTEGPGALSALRWIDPRIPDGAFRAEVDVLVGDRVDVRLRDATVNLEASDLTAEGGVTIEGGRLRLDGLRVGASPLVLSRLEPWLDRDLPLDGFLTGSLTFTGPLTALRTDGRVTLAPGSVAGGPTTADVDGTLHLGGEPGVTNLELRLDPLNFGLGEVVRPGLVPPGTGRATLTASGRLSSGLRFVADVSHGTDSLASRVVSRGTVRRTGGRPARLDVLTDFSPFSLDLLAALLPAAEPIGRVRGTVRTVGPLDTLRILGNVEAAGGSAEVDARINVFRPDSLYRVEAQLSRVALSTVSGRLPDPSIWTGRLLAEGSGFTPDSAEARFEVEADSSRIGGLHVDRVSATLRAGAGVLTVDTVDARVGGLDVQGGGSLGLRGEHRGEARFAVRTDSLGGLRPLLLGDTVIARDTLTVLDREFLRFEGIDPDTLPDTASVAMSGSLEADVRVTGWLESFGIEGSAVLTRGVYGMNRVDSVAATFRAEGLPRLTGAVELEVGGRGFEMEDRAFEELRGTLAMEDRAGQASVEVVREPGERLMAEGDFALDSLGGEVGLARARLELDTLAWETAGPSRIAWAPGSVLFQELEILRSGAQPMSATIDGTLSWEGDSDLVADVQGLHLGLVDRLLESEELAMDGIVDASLSLRGPSARPAIDGHVRWLQPRYGEVAMDSLSGRLGYADRVADIDFRAWGRDHLAFTARGTVPVDLALDSVGDRTVDRPMELRIEADSLAAANVLSFLGFLEDVEGQVSGEFDVAGTLDAPEPRGVLRLQDAAWTMEALGVRHQAINGSLTLTPDRTVQVELNTRAQGTSVIGGTVRLDPLTNPALDLAVSFQGFQAVQRSDIAGRISGEITVTGTYQRPLAQGEVRVDQGTLFLEEFARAAEVVDLSDPRILDVVDTTALSTRPILAGVRNPFLQNLRVDVDLSVPRDTWLRSSDMNVEMGGELLVTYDRTNRDLVLVGELQALRGSYTVLGRTFQVQSGTVGFIGTPGINPTLDIEAQTRIREREGDGIAVDATVRGNLTQPRVELSSEDAGLAESDLVSYLIFGRPSSEIAASFASGPQGGGFLDTAGGVGVTWATGTLANRLGSVLAREVGVDYLNITQAGNVAAASEIFAGTQIELGQYVAEDIFIILIFRPTAKRSAEKFGGARVEWTLNDPYTVEGFIEDRFLRSGASGFRDLAFDPDRIVGVFIFREWGY